MPILPLQEGQMGGRGLGDTIRPHLLLTRAFLSLVHPLAGVHMLHPTSGEEEDLKQHHQLTPSLTPTPSPTHPTPFT